MGPRPGHLSCRRGHDPTEAVAFVAGPDLHEVMLPPGLCERKIRGAVGAGRSPVPFL